MVPPVAVSPLIKTARYSALIAGIIYGKRRYDHLKPIAAEERRIEEEEKKVREEQERIAKQLAEGTLFTQTYCTAHMWTSQSRLHCQISYFALVLTANEDSILK
uniref:ATP synthase F(0) complex subunit e, mitochondrial n=3 Tax=Haplochromini TaxID=319058 RepID=A0A3Q2WZU1_HAPBU